jgi:hypothetical protein
MSIANKGEINMNAENLIHSLTAFDAEEYAENYEFRGDGGDYKPTDAEKLMIEDAITGAIGEIRSAVLRLVQEA